MTPLEYLRQWDEAPRLMAVFEVVQERARKNAADRTEKMAGAGGNTTGGGGSKTAARKPRPARRR